MFRSAAVLGGLPFFLQGIQMYWCVAPPIVTPALAPLPISLPRTSPHPCAPALHASPVPRLGMLPGMGASSKALPATHLHTSRESSGRVCLSVLIACCLVGVAAKGTGDARPQTASGSASSAQGSVACSALLSRRRRLATLPGGCHLQRRWRSSRANGPYAFSSPMLSSGNSSRIRHALQR